MSAIRQSNNFVWSVQEIIGLGSTGTVFKCMSKKDAVACAAKVFNSQADRRPYEVRIREIDLLKKLSHPNIVKLMGLEQEIGSKATVLIMELCGASLHDIIEEPENMYGLEDITLINIIRDICSGMEYLKNSNVVHRDVKPGNILRADKGYGEYIYKITDFGAARELGEAEQFVSVYGTEEYLHPDIYEKAVIKRSSNKSFSARVDMWSLGVTFYHLATGQLPFRPAGGRQNKDIMFKMISEKSNDAISCYQDLDSGKLIYSTDLPQKTRISQNLKNHLIPILKSLLQIDEKFMLSYEEFFESVKEIVSLKKFDVFSCDTFSLQKLFMNQNDMIPKNLFQYLGVTNGEIYFNEDLLSIDLPSLYHFKTSAEDPFIVLTDSQMSLEKTLYKYPTLQSFTKDDVKLSKMYAGYAHDIKRQAEYSILSCKLIKKFHNLVRRFFDHDCALLKETYQQKVTQTTIINTQLIRFKKLLNLKDSNYSPEISSNKDQQMFDCVADCFGDIETFFNDVLEKKSLTLNKSFDISDQWRWLESINYLVKIAQSVYAKFYGDKYHKRTVATLLDELVHKVEKERLQANFISLCNDLKNLTDYLTSLQREAMEWLSFIYEKKETITALRTKMNEVYDLFYDHYEQQVNNFEDEISACILRSKSLCDGKELQKQLALLDCVIPDLLLTASEQQHKLELLEKLDFFSSN